MHNSISVGTRGKYSASGAFSQKLDNALVYTCIAIDSIVSMINNAIDVKQDIYLANSIDVVRYEQDFSDGVPIFTLQSNKGDIVKIPGSFLLELPDTDGVVYNNIMLAINLGPVYDEFDLTQIKDELSYLVHTKVGIEPDIQVAIFGEPAYVSLQDHTQIQSARQAIIGNGKSTLSKYNKEKLTNELLIEKIALLEQYILDHQL